MPMERTLSLGVECPRGPGKLVSCDSMPSKLYIPAASPLLLDSPLMGSGAPAAERAPKSPERGASVTGDEKEPAPRRGGEQA